MQVGLRLSQKQRNILCLISEKHFEAVLFTLKAEDQEAMQDKEYSRLEGSPCLGEIMDGFMCICTSVCACVEVRGLPK